MPFRCIDCNQEIEGDPWWFDPLAMGPNVAVPPATLKGVVSQRPDRPTGASAPFHRECLERQMAPRRFLTARGRVSYEHQHSCVLFGIIYCPRTELTPANHLLESAP